MSSIILNGKTAKERKDYPLFSGFLNYFPDACLAVAHLSKIGNDQHNPGQPLHWSRDKSNDHLDTLARHLVDQAEVDTDGEEHLTKAAWRAMAALQTHLEKKHSLIAPGSVVKMRRVAGGLVPSVDTRKINTRRLCESEEKKVRRWKNNPHVFGRRGINGRRQTDL